MKIITLIGVCVFSLALSFNAMAKDWYYKIDPQFVYGDYGNSKGRGSSLGTGMFVSGDYLERAGYTVGYNFTEIDFHQVVSSTPFGKLRTPIPNVTQNSYFASGHWNFTPDGLPGAITARLDGHYLDNNDTTNGTDNVTVIAPQVSYLNFAKDFYFDLGYAHSWYTQSLDINQWTPTLGFGFNDGSDWLQIRGYFIENNKKQLVQNKEETMAMDLKLTHYLAPDNFAKLNNIQIGGLIGERVLAVDGGAASVYNLTDIQRGSASLGGQWKFSNDVSLLLSGGYENYKNNTFQDNYYNRYVYVNVSKSW